MKMRIHNFSEFIPKTENWFRIYSENRKLVPNSPDKKTQEDSGKRNGTGTKKKEDLKISLIRI